MMRIWCIAFDRVLSQVQASNLTIVDEDPCDDQQLLFHLASRQAMGMARCGQGRSAAQAARGAGLRG